MTRKDGASVQALGEKIFNLLRGRPHEPFTRKQIAEELGTVSSNTIFGMSIAYARKLASSAGDCITSCVWDADARAHAMRYLPEGQENEAALRPLFQRSALTQEHMTALRLEARYSAASADTEPARQHAEFTERAMAAANDTLQQANLMMLAIMEASKAVATKDDEIEKLRSRVQELKDAQPAQLF